MAYPPPVPPATRTNATVMATNHPNDHNLISAALTEILNHMATLEAGLYPIGTISMWGGDLPPGNHELCRGQTLSKTTYPEVFAFIGTKFNTGGEVATDFRMPDMKGRYPIGFNAGGGYFSAGIGERYGSADAQLPSHRHLGPDHLHGVSIWSDYDEGHWHQPANAGWFVVNGGTAIPNEHPGQGWMGSPQIPANIVPFEAHEYVGGTGNSVPHRHSVNGSTGAADRALYTDFQGVAATNANLPPSLSLNFIMRMH